ncbi:hypothetical protein KEM48_002657 [Puccinia striiformis f. sp. tritici PST-130]|nr:hypothetical protein KEM48_002657 [Puccinia striiformis f. sp. tritici PST-130]
MSAPHNHPHHNRPQRQQPPFSSPFVSQPELRPPRTAPLIHQMSPTAAIKTTENPTSRRMSPLQQGSYSPPHLDPSEPILQPAARDNLKSGVRFDAAQSSYDPQPHAATFQNGNSEMRRKKSLVRPDRAPIDPSHRLYNYRNHAAAMEADERGRVEVSITGATAIDGSAALAQQPFDSHAPLPEENSPCSNSSGPLNSGPSRAGIMAALGRPAPPSGYAGLGGGGGGGARPTGAGGLRRGQSILARRPGEAEESGLAILKRGETLRRNGGSVNLAPKLLRRLRSTPKPPVSPWAIYCKAITCCFPAFILSTCGIKSADRVSAWREKMGILFLIFALMAAVAFLTFGFTQTVCGKPPLRYHSGTIQPGMIIFHGDAYDFDGFKHVAAPGITGGDNPAYSSFNAGGMDASFLFQRVNQRCQDIITPAARTGIPTDGTGKLAWYFPAISTISTASVRPIKQYVLVALPLAGTNGYAEGRLCHNQDSARQALAGMKPLGQVYYTWNDLKNSSRNLVVYDSIVLDLNLLNWLDRSQVSYPDVFDDLKESNNPVSGQDITMQLLRAGGQQLGGCLTDIIQVGYIDTNTLGCVASTVVLYASLVVIIGVVLIKWSMAVWFAWFFGWRLGSFGRETAEQRAQRAAAIETWSSDIYRPAPAKYRPNARNAKKSLLPNTSRFTVIGKPGGGPGLGVSGGGARPMSTYVGEMNRKSMMYPTKPTGFGMKNSPPSTPGGLVPSLSAASLNQAVGSRRSSYLYGTNGGGCPFPLYNVVPQPPPDYEPFNFPLVHTICLVTAYSESVEGLRTTLDSLATTDYPNSHKFILVIADGKVKGSGNDMTTPEICLSMMKDLIVRPDEVEAKSYVAIADGHKRHNMAEVYAGFYSYDNDTVEVGKQQRVPMVLISKTGNADEQHESKPGNRGKRDSQVLLMSFLQKVMFDERMTEFDYEFFNSIWRVTGVSPDHYEICLMVDADTKVFPDAVSRMAACMVRDSEIMGLCGETKIANKSDSWVTMIQVFEYYISHHLQKSFESMFGGVTCLPGCFSMYRIKAPKGGEGYWVPILANPDIVEHYSENVVDTLHAKNLLLLGEDRFLTTLIVEDGSTQRYTIFTSFGTLVLPAAISFTGYIIVLTIIPGTEKPIISLILLAFILGLPGLLIVITSRRIAYVGWMLIYLLSLPIWNAVLPTYAYFHMDDFTWGETRKIEGAKETAHGDKEGEFDSSNITMKRWAEFDRERRWKTEQSTVGTLTETAYRGGTPLAPPSGRYSLNSSMDNWSSATMSDPYGNRMPSIQQLSLPQPLAREESKLSGQYLSNHRTTMMPSRQTSQDSFRGRINSFEASREPILPPFSDPIGSGPFEDQERVASNHEFSHLFQNTATDEDQQSSSHSTGLGGSSAGNCLEMKTGFAKGVSLSDTGAVPDSMGAMRRVDRPPSQHQSQQSSNHNPFKTSNSNQDDDLPSPPGFTTYKSSKKKQHHSSWPL